SGALSGLSAGALRRFANRGGRYGGARRSTASACRSCDLMAIIGNHAGNQAAPPNASLIMVQRCLFPAVIFVVQFANLGICLQTPAAKLDRVIGEVTAIDAGANRLTVKSDAGSPVTANLDDKTLYLSIPPGE